MRPVCLIIRDGWGYNENSRGNAVTAATTPNMDSYLKKYPWTLIDTSGEPVGLPEGYQGSSEVGHLNIGAGRIVKQEVKRIDDLMSDGSLYDAAKWKELISSWKSDDSQLHLLCLLQDEGVHAHQEQLFKIMRRARSENPNGRIVVHPFLDGRDTPPISCLEYLGQLNTVIKDIGGCVIGTVMGRYYAMDRSENWGLTDTSYNCIVNAVGKNTPAPDVAVTNSYKNDKTPDGADMFDEYILPHVIGDYKGVNENDCVIHVNYRQDRAIQLTKAFIDPDYKGSLSKRPRVNFIGLTRYYDEFPHYLISPMSEGGGMENLLGQVISGAGLKQLRIAETQKYRHVTSFMNGKSTTPYGLEDDVEVPGRFDPATFGSHPEMEAYRVTDALLAKLDSGSYDFIAVNFANCDMVGHTGIFEAAKTAVEIVDECVGRVVQKLLEMDAQILITSDHGNADQMEDYDTGMVKTSHTKYPVECIYIASDSPGKQMKEHGKLSDIAPTILTLLKLDIPEEMTADVLI